MPRPRCVCVYQRSGATWVLRLIHPACPKHGQGGEWKVVTGDE